MIFVHRGTCLCESDTKVTQTAARVAGDADCVDSVLGAVPAQQLPMDPDFQAERHLCAAN
jgi:hypothetical protein